MQSIDSVRFALFAQSVLSKLFTGEIVETEADLAHREGRDYEPASVLLERIAAERVTAENGNPKKRKKAKKALANKIKGAGA